MDLTGRRILVFGVLTETSMGYRIAEAVERDLARLLAERGLPPTLNSDLHVPLVDAGTYGYTPSAPAEATGAQVARAVYEGLSL